MVFAEVGPVASFPVHTQEHPHTAQRVTKAMKKSSMTWELLAMIICHYNMTTPEQPRLIVVIVLSHIHATDAKLYIVQHTF